MYIAIKNGDYFISDIPRALIINQPDILIVLPRQDIATIKKVADMCAISGKLSRGKAEQLVEDFARLD